MFLLFRTLLTYNHRDDSPKRKKEGLTEEIKSGKTLTWEELAYTFEPAIP